MSLGKTAPTEKFGVRVEKTAEAAEEKQVAEVLSGEEMPKDAKDIEVKESQFIKGLDLHALWVVERLKLKGYKAYLTGGCVRDLILGKTPKDFDVATSAKPHEVKQVFRYCRLVGRRFLLAHVVFPGGKIIETATFRKKPAEGDKEQEDLLVTRDNVYGTEEEDADRRDFTINGLFYDPTDDKIIDYVEGQKDLELKTIRTIGDPEVRFREDPVRMLRAVKFSSRLEFPLEAKTREAIVTHASDVLRSSPPRLHEELYRLLISKNAERAVKLCQELGLLDALMPELTEVLQQDLESAEEAKDPSSVHERQEYFVAMIKALDETTQRDVDVSPSVAFAALLLSAYDALEVSSENERQWVDQLCLNWSQRIHFARRDQDRIRLLLSTVSMFEQENLTRRTANYIVQKSWFKEALLLYIMHLKAKGLPLDKVDMWKAVAKDRQKPYIQDEFGRKKVRSTLRNNQHRRRPQYRRKPRTA